MKSHDDRDQHDWIMEARRRLAAKRGKRPATKASQIWALWPEIKLAVSEGQSIDTICRSLDEEAGIQLTPKALTSYIARCRRKEKLGCTPPRPEVSATRVAATGHDPMASARRALDKSRFSIKEIHGDGDPSKHNLI